MTILNRYLTTSSLSAGAKLFSIAANILLLWLVSHSLPKDDFGLFIFVYTVFLSFALIGASPLYSVVLYRIARMGDAGNTPEGRGFIGTLALWAVVAGIILAGVFAGSAALLEGALQRPGIGLWIGALAFILPIDMGRIVLNMGHRARGDIVTMTLLQDGVLNITRLILMGVSYLCDAGAIGIVTAFLTGHGLTALLSYGVDPVPLRPINRNLMRHDFMYGLKSMGSKSFDEQTRSLDQLILGLIPSISAATLADYAVASRIARLLFLPKQAIAQYMLPRLGNLLGAGDTVRAGREYRHTQIISLIIAMMLCAGLCASAGWILSFFGEFQTAVPLLLILAAVSLFENGTGFMTGFLAMAGAPGRVLAGRVISGIVMLGGGFVVAPLLGGVGVASTVLLAVIVSSLYMGSIMIRQDKTNPFPLQPMIILGTAIAVLWGAALGGAVTIEARAILAGLLMLGVLALIWGYRREIRPFLSHFK